jgi:hypothetical protein
MSKPLFDPKVIIPAFDRFLESHRLSFSAIAIGGAALAVLGVITRGTRDVDLIDTVIPVEILNAAREFAAVHFISIDWLNNGPSSLARDLPPEWRNRIQKLYIGDALQLWTLCRMDLIRSKFWAMCDRMRDVDDLVEMAPTDEEIATAAFWVKPLDGNPKWPDHVDIMVKALRKRLSRD